MKCRITIFYEFVFVGMLVFIVSFLPISIYAARGDQAGQEEEKKEASVAVIPQAPSVTQAQTAVEEKRAAERQERMTARQAERERREREEGEVKEIEEKESAVGKTGQKIDTNVHTLLMFFDNGEIVREDQNSFTTRAAVDAMKQEASPMIISGLLLAHIFTRDGNHEEITKAFLEDFYTKFDATRWVVYGSQKQEGDVLSHDFLLIPKIAERRVIKTKVEDFNIEGLEKIETAEKNALEIYFNAPKNVAGRQITLYDFARQLAMDGKFLEEYPKKFLSFLKYVLLPRDRKSDMDYSDRLTDKAARWIFVHQGHGEYGKSIAGLSIEENRNEFQQLLDFFDKKIKVKLFVYNSCYAAGYNADKVYGELTGASGARVYPFGIVTSAITDAPIVMVLVAQREGIVASVESYVTFFVRINQEPVNYSLALSYLFPIVKRASSGIRYEGSLNIPQMRPPNVPAWFPVVDADKAVVRIGKIMADTRKKDLIIKQYMDGSGKAQDPKAILLATNEVPFPVVIDAGIVKKPPFISLLPGGQEHILQSVKYEGMEFDTFSIDMVVGKPEYGVIKTYRIQELKIVNKKGESNIFNNVKIEVQEEIISAAARTEKGKQHVFVDIKAGEDLLDAVRRQDAGAVERLLVYANALVNYKDKYGNTALIMLAPSADEQAVKAIAQLLIAYGADVNAMSEISEQDGGSRRLTVLQFACAYNNPLLVKLLLESNKLADINAQDKRGDTALHIAIWYTRSKAIVKLLLQYNANPDLKNKLGQSPRDMDAKLIKEAEQELAPEKHKQLESWKKWREKSEKRKGRQLYKKKGKQQLFPYKIRPKK